MLAILIVYHKFTKSLIDIGFEINPYDPCVTNKIIDGSKMTICFHVDDCKLSNRKCKINYRMTKWLCQEKKGIFKDGSGKMSASRGNIHDYLGMNLDYIVYGKVRIATNSYIEEIIAAFDKSDPKE